MSHSRRANKYSLDHQAIKHAPSLYEYLTLSVEDCEYPTAVPLLASLLAAGLVIGTVDKVTGWFGLFDQTSKKTRHHPRHAFLDIDGVDDEIHMSPNC
jgi:hypothetical protein